MAYNLRSRTIHEELLADTEEVIEEQECEEMDGIGDEGDSNYSDSSEENGSEDDIEMEDVSLNERILQSAARGHPCSKWKGKNGFTWDTSPSRLFSSVQDWAKLGVEFPRLARSWRRPRAELGWNQAANSVQARLPRFACTIGIFITCTLEYLPIIQSADLLLCSTLCCEFTLLKK